MAAKFQFYEVVRFVGSNDLTREVEGAIGAVFGMAQDDDGQWEYAVYVFAQGICWSIDEKHLESTGEVKQRSDFYDGTTVRVSIDPETGEGQVVGVFMSIQPADALIVVDVQNDFCPSGALAVNEGDGVVPVINSLLSKFEAIVFTRDWHPPNHCSFADEPRFTDGSWPVHCVRDTPGAAFHPELRVPGAARIIDKATELEPDAYSGFDRTDLAEWLRQRGVQRVFVCGLATEYCVRATALDALKAGFTTFVIADACRAVDNPPGTGDAALRELESAGAIITQSDVIS